MPAETAFDDIEALAAACRFTNCGHASEPGCAVRGAIERGELAAGRLEAYLASLQASASRSRGRYRR